MSLGFYLGRDEVTFHELDMKWVRKSWARGFYALNRGVMAEITSLAYSGRSHWSLKYTGNGALVELLGMFRGLQRARRIRNRVGMDAEDVLFEKIGGEWKRVEEGKGI